MVEKKGISYWFTHVVLSIGVLIIIFPVWLAFVASNVTKEEIIRREFFINKSSNYSYI